MMLVLTRKQNESIYIGDDIRVTILEMKGRQVSVGIEAPRDVNIAREEIINPNPCETSRKRIELAAITRRMNDNQIDQMLEMLR